MTKKISLFLIHSLLLPLIFLQACAGIVPETESVKSFTIINPYENVNWSSFGRYRAALHIHTTRSDGNAAVAETVLDLYNKGFDIIAITDHSNMATVHDGNWAAGLGALSLSQKNAVIAGTFGRTAYAGFSFPGAFGPGFHRPAAQGGMIPIPFSNEQSRSEHIITMWANFSDAPGATQASTLQTTNELGGIAIIAHPGRYTTGSAGGIPGIASSNNPARISHYAGLFYRFPAALGFELFNRNDHETRSDRVLWDNVLKALMPYGRFVWGFSNDDSHSMNQAGFNWNVLLMESLDADKAKRAMKAGEFYMVTRVNRGVGPADPEVNARLPGGGRTPTRGNSDTIFMLHQTTPSIHYISVNDNRITIKGKNYDRIEWIADGAIIYMGATLNPAIHWHYINHNYVRAQLVSSSGVAMTQPFGILPAGEEFRQRLPHQ